MHRLSPRSRAIYRRRRQFNTWKAKLYYQIKDRFFKFVDQISIGEIVAHEKEVRHLDLAVKSTIGGSWRKHAMTQMALNISQECTEFLLAERWFTGYNMFARLHELAINYCNYRLEHFKNRFKNEMHECFENVFFQRISFFENTDRKKAEISRYLRLYSNFSTVHFFTVYRRLLLLCTNPPLDYKLTVDMLRTICVDDNLQRLAFGLVPDPDTLEIVLCQAKRARFDFWGLWLRNGGVSSLFNPIMDFMSSGVNLSCARILLKYGFRYSTEFQVHGKQLTMLRNRRIGGMSIISLSGVGQFLTSRNVLRTMLIVETFTAFADFEGVETKDERILTLIYLTRTLTEPYITPSELYHEMNDVISPFVTDDLLRICNTYEKANIFNGDYKVYQPRRLSHLVRCVVRNIMAEKMILPESVYELPLPPDIQSFLDLRS